MSMIPGEPASAGRQSLQSQRLGLLLFQGLKHEYVSFIAEVRMTLRRFIIERDIPKVGTFEREQLRGAAANSNEVLDRLAPDIQWVESYVADDKTFCVYL